MVRPEECGSKNAAASTLLNSGESHSMPFTELLFIPGTLKLRM